MQCWRVTFKKQLAGLSRLWASWRDTCRQVSCPRSSVLAESWGLDQIFACLSVSNCAETLVVSVVCEGLHQSTFVSLNPASMSCFLAALRFHLFLISPLLWSNPVLLLLPSAKEILQDYRLIMMLMENMSWETDVSRVAFVSLLILTPPRTSWKATESSVYCGRVSGLSCQSPHRLSTSVFKNTSQLQRDLLLEAALYFPRFQSFPLTKS